MVKSCNGEMFVIPKEFEEEVRADERTKCKCPYWNEEHRECATSFEEDIRAYERAKMIDEVDTIIDFIKNNSFDHNLEFDSFKAIGSSVVISLLEQLKEQKNDSRRILET